MPVRLLAAIVISCLAYAQIAVAAHEGTYGDQIHYHDGQLCAISLHGDRHNHAAVPPAAGIVITLRPFFIFRPVNEARACRALIRTHRARAPPIA